MIVSELNIIEPKTFEDAKQLSLNVAIRNIDCLQLFLVGRSEMLACYPLPGFSVVKFFSLIIGVIGAGYFVGFNAWPSPFGKPPQSFVEILQRDDYYMVPVWSEEGTAVESDHLQSQWDSFD